MKVKRILNVGCGFDTYGTDFIDLYPQRKEVKRCDIDNDRFPYKDNTFYEVYSKSNFEHLTNPSHFLKEAYRVLISKGTIKIITDNAGYFGFFGKIHHGGYEEALANKFHLDTPQDRHYMLFTPHHLKNWLDKFGFIDIKTQYAICDPKAPNQIISGMLNKKLMQFIIATGKKP